MTEIKDITIPENALTTCPDKRYGLVSVAHICVTCPYFRGLYDVMEKDASFAEKYRVQCGVPQVREITQFETGAA